MASPSSVIVGTADSGRLGKPLLQIVKGRLAFGQAKPPTVIVDDDGDMIGIVEGRGASVLTAPVH